MGVELVGVEQRAVDRAASRPAAAPSASAARAPAAAASEWPSSALLEEDLAPNQRAWRAIDASAVTIRTSSMQRLRGSLSDQVEEEGLGESVALVCGQQAVEPPVGHRESLHRNDRGRVQVVGRRPHGVSG